jgi:NAD(P)-dependent dehydrogenase (short-subunit alcohol dehydrogenase family)
MKKIIVTGAAGQLGADFCNYLAGEGYYIVAADLQEPVPFLQKNIKFEKLNISDEHQVISFFENHADVYGLINNAGVGVFSPFESRTIDEFEQVIDVNVKGTWLMCREAVKKMASGARGKIVNVASIYGVVSSDPSIYGKSGRNNSEVYTMSKAAVIGLTKYLACHYAEKNIQVNALSPGGVYRSQEEFFVKRYVEKTPARRMAAVQDFHDALSFLLSETNTYTNGINLVIDGGFTSW